MIQKLRFAVDQGEGMRGHQMGRWARGLCWGTYTETGGRGLSAPVPPPRPKYPFISAERAVTSDGRYVFPEQLCQGELGWLCRGCPGGAGAVVAQVQAEPPRFPQRSGSAWRTLSGATSTW